eukprot:TRINITY_DN5016_c0_g1_i1.p1 TRINITY_DN5016_c0_g1~~TRINITY_DN5016_c0_g1_i1.p1  ORF type:complete len:190 (-),score=41.31 TRINITY_DN5016_c0_g1_i1:77-625(-)
MSSSTTTFLDPYVALKGGYDVHVYFTLEQHAKATSLYHAFLAFLADHRVKPTFSFIYDQPPNFEGGPHKGPMWVVQLMGINPARDIIQEGGAARAIEHLGVALSWLMLNRQGLKVLVHPNVALPFGQVAEEKIDHDEYAVWMGIAHDPSPPELDIAFFDMLLSRDAKEVEEEAVQRLASVQK